jgi:hypothetical protein
MAELVKQYQERQIYWKPELSYIRTRVKTLCRRSANLETLEDIQKFIYSNLEERKPDNQDWFIFLQDLLDSQIHVNDDEEFRKVRVGLGRQEAQENETDNKEYDPFLIGILN